MQHWGIKNASLALRFAVPFLEHTVGPLIVVHLLKLIWQSRCQSPRSSVGGIVGLWENAEENQPLIGCLIIIVLPIPS